MINLPLPKIILIVAVVFSFSFCDRVEELIDPETDQTEEEIADNNRDSGNETENSDSAGDSSDSETDAGEDSSDDGVNSGNETDNSGAEGVGDEISDAIAQMEADVLKYVNEHRVSNGRSALSANSYMSGEARTHSSNMANNIVPFGHEGFNERANRIWVNVGTGGVAENVAYNSNGAEQVFDQWKNSSGHNKNMLGDYNLTGIGIYQSGNRLYFTQLFLSR
jgi:uncharacterized protein YkwD